MQDKYCLPIVKKSTSDVLDMIQANHKNYGYFEVWLDYVEELDRDFITDLCDTYPGQLVFTLRLRDSTTLKMDKHRLLGLIEFLSKKDCLLDLDITQAEAVKFAEKLKMQSKLILSFHDYLRTPEDKYLDKIVDKMRSFKPGILKISTMTKSPQDALRLMKYKRDFLESGEKHIVLGMGEYGKITRVFGTLWKNELIYIPENESENSAPGQISRLEFDKILERTHV